MPPETDLPDPFRTPPVALVSDLERMELVSRQAQWQAFLGGRTNHVWHVCDLGAEYVVKLFAPASSATPLFRNDPLAEAAVLDLLAGSGLSPRLVYHGTHSAGEVVIYEHQKGVPWRSGTEQVAAVLRALHSRQQDTKFVWLPVAPDGSKELTQQTLAILKQTPADLAAPILDLRPGHVVVPSGYRCLLHGDPVPDNVVCPPGKTGTRAVLIDWQCPALGDPVLDLALFLSPAMQQVGRGSPLSQEERCDFLSAYGDPLAEARLAALQPFLHWRMVAYCLWKITRDRPDPAYGPALDVELSALKQLL